MSKATGGSANPVVVDSQDGPKKHPVFDSIVKNFSQMAYMHGSSNDLSLFPHVR